MANIFEGQFEPFAVQIGEAMPDVISTAVVAQISEAVSAKRQADALERIADALHTLNNQDIFHPDFGLNSAAWRLAKP